MSAPHAAPTGRRVFREEIKDFLVEAILSGDLQPGDRIVETRVAQQLGVSQAPVREALRDLALIGFVTSLPFRETRVRQIADEDLVEIYAIRAALEGVAARAAATHIDQPTLARLDDLLDAMRKAAARDDQRAFAEADIAFHHLILEASGNRALSQLWEHTRLATTTFLTMRLMPRPLGDLVERHRPLRDAIRDRDPARAEASMRRHFEELEEELARSAGPHRPSDATSAAVVSRPRTKEDGT